MKKRTSASAITFLAVSLSLILIAFLIYFIANFLSPEKLTVTFKSADATKNYDGMPLQDGNWEILWGMLRGPHTARVNVYGTQTDVGSSLNEFDVSIHDFFGNDVSDQYEIILEPGILTVVDPDDAPQQDENFENKEEDEESSPSGPDPSTPGFVPDNDETDFLLKILASRNGIVYLRHKSYGNYTGSDWDGWIRSYANATPVNPLLFPSFAMAKAGYTMEEMQIVTGTGQYYSPYHFNDRNLCDTDDRVLPYGGKEYTVHYYYDYNVSTLKELSLDGTDYMKAESDYRIYVHANYLKLTNNEKTVLLKLAAEAGISAEDPYVIEKVAKYIQNAATYNLNYKPYPADVNHVTYFLLNAKEGVCEQYASAATLMYRALGIPARYVTGYMTTTVANEWVQVNTAIGHAWVEVYIDGLGWIPVEVTGSDQGGSEDVPELEAPPQSMTISPVYAAKKYDGTPLLPVQNKVTGFEKWEKDGYSYTATISGSQTDYGYGVSTIDAFTVFDPDGNEVTNQFDFTLANGRLHVYYSILSASSNNLTKTYDAAPVDISYIVPTGAMFAPRHVVKIETSATTDAGLKYNSFTMKVLDEKGNDVSYYYEFDRHFGELNIKPREITIKANDASKVYDGTPLTCNTYTVTAGSLLTGQKISSYTITGSQIEIGRSENLLTAITIMDSNGNNVTANYAIKPLPGKLYVTGR